MEKEIEGQTWILKSRVEEIIQNRISKVATRASNAEETIAQLQEQLEQAQKAQSSIDILQNRVQELEGNLEKSNTRYSRYQAITKHGLQGEDMLEAIEYAYERSQGKLDKKEQQDLASWLDNMVQNPDQAPAIIRPHLQNITAPAPAQEHVDPSTVAQLQELAQHQQNNPAPIQPPRVNQGVQRTPEPSDILERALRDPQFYSQNRERVQEAWRSQAGKLRG